MKQLGIFIALLSLVVSAVTGCQPQFQPGAYVDDMGREVTIDKVPQRIVAVVADADYLFLQAEGKKGLGYTGHMGYNPLGSLVYNYLSTHVINIGSRLEL